MASVWILTRETHQYDQGGEYFVAAFAERPSVGLMAEVLGEVGVQTKSFMDAYVLVEHVRAGGGRRGDEEEWFYLREVALRRN